MQGFLREALFNILSEKIVDSSVLDLFSGTGSIGLEALSRGARSSVFFEKDRSAVQVLRKNLKSMDLDKKSKVFFCNILRLKTIPETPYEPYDLVILDPPFSFHDTETRRDLNPLILRIEEQGLLGEDPLLILQVRKNQTPPAVLGKHSIFDKRDHGSVSLTLYK